MFHFVFFDCQNGDYTLHTGVLLTSKLHHLSYLVFLQCVFLWVQVVAMFGKWTGRGGTHILKSFYLFGTLCTFNFV